MQYYGNISSVFTLMVVINVVLIMLNKKGGLFLALRIYGFMELGFIAVGIWFISHTFANANIPSMILFAVNLAATFSVAILNVFVHGRKQS